MDIVRSWREQKLMLKWRFPFLSEEDLTFEEDNKEDMINRLAKKINTSKKELLTILAELQRF